MRFISTKDIMSMCGCSRSTAQKMKKAAQDETVKKGYIVANNRTCLYWVFAEIYGLKKDYLEK